MSEYIVNNFAEIIYTRTREFIPEYTLGSNEIKFK